MIASRALAKRGVVSDVRERYLSTHWRAGWRRERDRQYWPLATRGRTPGITPLWTCSRACCYPPLTARGAKRILQRHLLPRLLLLRQKQSRYSAPVWPRLAPPGPASCMLHHAPDVWSGYRLTLCGEIEEVGDREGFFYFLSGPANPIQFQQQELEQPQRRNHEVPLVFCPLIQSLLPTYYHLPVDSAPWPWRALLRERAEEIPALVLRGLPQPRSQSGYFLLRGVHRADDSQPGPRQAGSCQ